MWWRHRPVWGRGRGWVGWGRPDNCSCGRDASSRWCDAIAGPKNDVNISNDLDRLWLKRFLIILKQWVHWNLTRTVRCFLLCRNIAPSRSFGLVWLTAKFNRFFFSSVKSTCWPFAELKFSNLWIKRTVEELKNQTANRCSVNLVCTCSVGMMLHWCFRSLERMARVSLHLGCVRLCIERLVYPPLLWIKEIQDSRVIT